MVKPILLALAALSLVSCGSTSSSSSSAGTTILGEDLDLSGGADYYSHEGDHSSDIYYAHPDYYNLVSNDHLTILSHFATFQQTTEYTCGQAAVLMALYHLGIKDYTERSLALGMGTAWENIIYQSGEFGTPVAKMYDFLSKQEKLKVIETSYKASYSPSDLLTADSAVENDVGNLPPTFDSWAIEASGLDANGDPIYVDDAKDFLFVSWIISNLKKGLPILVDWGDWDGHWQDIIGYDTMGTSTVVDDTIIFADPYDTGDHLQDGYYSFSADRFFVMWKDRRVEPRPFQLQPYLIFDLK